MHGPHSGACGVFHEGHNEGFERARRSQKGGSRGNRRGQRVGMGLCRRPSRRPQTSNEAGEQVEKKSRWENMKGRAPIYSAPCPMPRLAGWGRGMSGDLSRLPQPCLAFHFQSFAIWWILNRLPPQCSQSRVLGPPTPLTPPCLTKVGGREPARRRAGMTHGMAEGHRGNAMGTVAAGATAW